MCFMWHFFELQPEWCKLSHLRVWLKGENCQEQVNISYTWSYLHDRIHMIVPFVRHCMFYVVYHHHSIISFVCVCVCVDPLSIVSIILWTKLNLPFGYIIICQSLVMVLNHVYSVHINRWTGLTDHVLIAIFHIRLADHVVIVIFI